jgi:poly(A) polymerase
VRFIGEAAERIAEDGLRVYRFFRFTASHGGEKLDADGLAACQAAVGRLDHLSAERVGSEMIRILGLTRVAMTLGIMAEIGLLELSRAKLASVVRYELLGGADVATRLSIIAGEELEHWQERWRLSNALVDKARRISSAAALVARDEIALAVYRYREDAVEALARAAAEGNWPRDRLMEAARELARLPKPDMPVSGKDLIAKGMKPGPEIGDLLARLENAWVESGFTLSREDLLARII